jgi:hypothetical protein
MIAIEVQQFLGRARDFLKGMDLLKDDLPVFRFSSALLGIHCAISYSDALRTGLGCTGVSADDHRTAASDLKSLLAARKFEKLQGADRLAKLQSKKRRIAYASEATRQDEVEDIVKLAERFAFWSEEAGRKLKIEGW